MVKRLILIIVFFLGYGCAGGPSATSTKKDGTPIHLWDYDTSHFNFYSVNVDAQLGNMVLAQQIGEFQKKGIEVNPSSEEVVRGRITGIVKKIASISDHPEFKYEVVIFDKRDVVNAFCLPGGKIGIFTGLYDLEKGLINKNNDDEIAAVMGHEIAHATLRHVTRRLTKMQGISFLGSVASYAIGQGVGTDWQGVFDQTFSLGINLYLPSYSRKFEREADQVGFYYMARAGYDPQAAITIWKKASSKKKGSDKTHFLASHPASGERAKNLEAWLNEARLVGQGLVR